MEFMKKFNWITETELRQKKDVETEISACLDDLEIKPCCIGEMTIKLAINGPLNNILEGLVKCSCGKELCEFKGGSMASKLDFKIFTE